MALNYNYITLHPWRIANATLFHDIVHDVASDNVSRQCLAMFRDIVLRHCFATLFRDVAFTCNTIVLNDVDSFLVRLQV